MKLWDKRQGKLIPFTLWPKQLELLDLIHTKAWLIILKKRQVGASQLVGADSLVNMMAIPNWVCLVLSKSGSDAEEFLRRVKEGYESLDPNIQAATPIKRSTAETLEFQNGSRMVSLSSNRGAGMTADRVVIDEGAFITKAESGIDLQTVLRRTQPTVEKADGQLIIISTSNGFNLFRELYYRAKALRGKLQAFFFSCWDDPTFTPEDREILEDQFGEDHVNQEYPRTDTEAFLSSGRPRFDHKTLARYEAENLIIPTIYQADFVLPFTLNPNSRGNFRLFAPRDPYAQYLIVADVSEGLGIDYDPCVAKAFTRGGDQIAEYYDSDIAPDDFGDALTELARYFNNALLIVEKNKDGNTTLSRILSNEYPEELIFAGDATLKPKADDEFRKGLARYGWRTTASTRPLALNALNAIIQAGTGSFCQEDIDEMRAFTINKGKAAAESGLHDDRVITLAIGYYLLQSEAFYQFYPTVSHEKYDTCAGCDSYCEDNSCELTDRKCKPSDWCTLYSGTYANMLKEVSTTLRV